MRSLFAPFEPLTFGSAAGFLLIAASEFWCIHCVCTECNSGFGDICSRRSQRTMLWALLPTRVRNALRKSTWPIRPVLKCWERILTEPYDLVIENGTIWSPTSAYKADIAVRAGKIVAIGGPFPIATKRIDARGHE